MKALLEFNLPEDKESYEIHRQAVEMSIALYEICYYIRNLYKHGHSFKDADEAIEVIRQFIIDNTSDLQDII